MEKKDGVFAKKLPGGKILCCTDEPLQHWVVRYDGRTIVLNVNRAEIEPEILSRNGFIFIGVEQGVFVIEKEGLATVNEIHDISLVQWVEAGSPEYVIFSAEDELLAFDNYGQFMWRKNLPDVIETTDVEDDCVIVRDMSGEKYLFDIRSGMSLRNCKK